MPAANAFARGTRTVPLVRLAWGRSGDKGDAANIGILAHKPGYLPFIRAALTEQAVAAWFAHLVKGSVQRIDRRGTEIAVREAGPHCPRHGARHALGQLGEPRLHGPARHAEAAGVSLYFTGVRHFYH